MCQPTHSRIWSNLNLGQTWGTSDVSDWNAKRFWAEVTVKPKADGFAISLDGRPALTPGKAPMIVPTLTLAEHVAAEWDAQSEKVDPSSMPLTLTANAAIDNVAQQMGEVAEILAAYGDSDLLCYRAEAPAGLIARQTAAWDPLLDWAAEKLQVRLSLRTGVVYSAQEPGGLERFLQLVQGLSNFELAAFHNLVSLSGSLVIGFAVARQARPDAELWAVSRIDENWQREQWGEDAEAIQQELRKRRAFLDAAEFLHACGQ